jgi:DNA-binding protein HU-beta
VEERVPAKFVVSKSRGGYSIALMASNGRKIADLPSAKDKRAVNNAIATLKRNASGANVEGPEDSAPTKKTTAAKKSTGRKTTTKKASTSAAKKSSRRSTTKTTRKSPAKRSTRRSAGSTSSAASAS